MVHLQYFRKLSRGGKERFYLELPCFECNYLRSLGFFPFHTRSNSRPWTHMDTKKYWRMTSICLSYIASSYPRRATTAVVLLYCAYIEAIPYICREDVPEYFRKVPILFLRENILVAAHVKYSCSISTFLPVSTILLLSCRHEYPMAYAMIYRVEVKFADNWKYCSLSLSSEKTPLCNIKDSCRLFLDMLAPKYVALFLHRVPTVLVTV